MVSPATTYRWKKGYAQAMGSTMNTTTAIRMVWLGRLLSASAPLAPIMELFRARNSEFFCISISRYCRG